MSVLRGFREFVMRGNVVDLAVGIVIGAAFTGLVNQLTGSFLEPLIRLVGGGGRFGGQWRVNGQVFDWGALINAAVTFLLTAAVLYFVVVIPMNKLRERMARGEVPEPTAPTEEVRLLTEIRDALTTRTAAPVSQHRGE